MNLWSRWLLCFCKNLAELWIDLKTKLIQCLVVSDFLYFCWQFYCFSKTSQNNSKIYFQNFDKLSNRWANTIQVARLLKTPHRKYPESIDCQQFSTIRNKLWSWRADKTKFYDESLVHRSYCKVTLVIFISFKRKMVVDDFEMKRFFIILKKFLWNSVEPIKWTWWVWAHPHFCFDWDFPIQLYCDNSDRWWTCSQC